MRLHEFFDRKCVKYLRATTQPDLQAPIPSAWVIAAAQGQNSATIYWVDLALRHDGCSRWHLATRYPRTTLVDPCFRPLTRLRKLTYEQHENYLRVHGTRKREWREKSARLSAGIEMIPAWWHRWFPPLPARDIVLRSEYGIRWLGSQSAKYLRETTVKADHIDQHYFRDGRRQVVAYATVDAALQTLHLPDVWRRVWYLDHQPPRAGIYADGLSAGYVGDVVRPSTIFPRCESMPFTGEPTQVEPVTFSQWLGAASKFLEQYK